MKKVILFLLAGVLTMSALSIQSCVKKGNDMPEDQTGFDPKIPVTHTIAELLALPMGATITEDIVVSGVVVMDDRGGNYYKKFVIQDETGGIEINLDQNNIYNDYPVGRKVYVKCKELTLTNYFGTNQLGYGIDERGVVAIPFLMADVYIEKATFPVPISVDTFTYDQLSDPSVNESLVNKLVAIKGVQFAGVENSDLNYSTATGATSRDLEGCGSSSTGIVIRTSQYARFQGAKLPKGSGVIVGIYTRYKSGARDIPQLIIRDTTDIIFGTSRCVSPELLYENFNGGTKTNPIDISGWVNFAEVGNQKYIFDGNSNLYAKISAFSTGESSVISWLVTPGVQLSGFDTYKLSVSTTYGFPDAATFKAYITDDFNGTPSASTWVELDEIIEPGLLNWQWRIKTVAIPDIFHDKQVYIAFKYVGSATSGASGTYELDNVKILGE